MSDKLQKALRDFAEARDWDQFHSPKNLAMALAGEAGELLAEFQWLTEEESRSPSDDQLERIRDELADVYIYLVRLADKLSVDVESAAFEKLSANEERYPARLARGRADKYTELEDE